MNFGNEQMIKTFEQLFHLRMKSPSIDPGENPPKKSRLFYRINREKLQKYHREHPFTSNKAPTIVEYPLKPTILLRKTIGTQTQSHSSSSNSLQTSSSVSYGKQQMII